LARGVLLVGDVLRQLPLLALGLAIGCGGDNVAPSFDLDEDPDALNEFEGKIDGDPCAAYPGGALSGSSLLALINKDDEQQLAGNWMPGDLVGIHPRYMMPGRTGLLRKVAADAFADMAAAAEAEDGLQLGVRSAYRSFRTQCITFDFQVRQHGLEHAKRFSAEPGRSQHQLATTVDITSADLGWAIVQSMGNSPEGKWLADNAHRFGFALSYPEGFESVTGYAYEPWHYRFIGRDAAREMGENGTILESYLSDCQEGIGACLEEEMDAFEPNTGFIGGACESDDDCASIGNQAFCLDEVDGYPGGYCTLPCDRSCPDREGAHAVTGCALTELGGACHSRCSDSLFPEGGCREGYRCESTARPQGDEADLCVPE
jgi:D-alanyl-D-alanine carboxypeptidase